MTLIASGRRRKIWDCTREREDGRRSLLPSEEEGAPQGVERRPSFDGLWRGMRAFDVSGGPVTNTLTLTLTLTLTPNPFPERRGEFVHV
jgi:hypothetical protein